jgi:hypothetical protein
MRMLEIFTSYTHIKKSIQHEHEDQIAKYLMNLFGYLTDNNYFNYLRKMIDDKIPDSIYLEESTKPHNQQSEALLDMLQRPLHLISSNTSISQQYV